MSKVVQKITFDTVEKSISDFQELLNTANNEEELHRFLAANPYFFNSVIRVFDSSPLYSKVKLGSEYEMDFCYMDHSSYGPIWTLIELERPNFKLFTKTGDPTQKLVHGIRQIQDWHLWITENSEYARRLMPGILYPEAYLFIGRRAELNSKDKMDRLRRMNYDLRNVMKIKTFDSLISNAKSILQYLSKESQNSLEISIPTLSHKDLLNGLSESTQNFIEYHKQNKWGKAEIEFEREQTRNEDFDWYSSQDENL